MTARKRSRGRRRKKVRPARRRLAAATVVVAAAGAVWLLWPFWQSARHFGDRADHQPSRLYGRALALEVGLPGSADDVGRELEALGYRKVAGRAPAATGEYRRLHDGIVVRLRDRPTPEGWLPAGELDVRFRGARVARLSWRGEETTRAVLEPPLIASYYGPERGERRPAPLEAIPETLIRAVLAAEDAGFYHHPGLSPTGIVRAAWVNLRGGEVRQGGSTLTQQLVKNLFLSHERSLGRKLREAALALLIDLRYSKRDILEAYLNEIYWGSSGSVNLMGVGAASWAYFGKRPAELDLCESALLAGMIRSPGRYAPARHPERARARRDQVLERMGELEWIESDRLASALAAPLCHDPHPLPTRTARYFADAAAAEAARRFGVAGLDDGGYHLLSTVERYGQRRAEEAVDWGLEALEGGWEKGREAAAPLQAALVSVDPRSGALLAYVGGRNYAASQFDRAASARRQAGSAFKPVVYATAFERGTQAPSSFVEDAPLTVALAGRRWSPQNDDGAYDGWVTVRAAVERSLNVPTVRVAMDAGLEEIVDTARAMGVRGRLDPYPALALGGFEVTPLELATVYATLAAGGLRPSLHGLEAVLAPDGSRIAGEPLPSPPRALSPESAYLMTSVLQGVLDRGTGSGARHQGLTDPLAGKTGTTNERRDSWFVGYSPDRVTLVWVGYDDNSRTNLSGSRAALPIWTRFTYAVRPPGGYRLFSQPHGVVTAAIDPASGELATGRCPQYLTEVFRAGHVPGQVCHLHADWRDWRGRPGVREDPTERRRLIDFLRRIFGKKKRDRP